MPRTCWNCGVEQRWQCQRCGGFEKRRGRSDCAECHRRASREQKPQHPGLTLEESALFSRLLLDDFEDVPLTGRACVYLAAFEAWLAESSFAHAESRVRALLILEGERP